MNPVPAPGTSLALFTRAAEAASRSVIRAYSTSFGLATALLGRRHRAHVRNIYALVRVADEIVDGVAAEAGYSADDQLSALDGYQDAVHRALRTGYSSDLVVHAFAITARESGIDAELVDPFFASMRSDIDDAPATHDEESHRDYVYGSAEVVGLMCLRVFLREERRDDHELALLHKGARRLGAAFQNVNFLRDLADDTARLGRSYLGERRLTDADRDAWIAEVHGQLDDAREAIPLLPRDARAAVRTALGLFAALTERVARTPAEDLYRRRVRVPGARKAVIAASALLRTATEGLR